MKEIFHFLQSIHPLSPELIDYLSENLKCRHVSKKEYLLKAGHVSRSICFIKQGLLRAFYINGNKDVTSWFMLEGDITVSIESFYDQKESYEYIQALEDCVLYYIDYKELEYIYHQFEEFNFIGRVLTIKYHKLWAQQLYSIRMQSATDRYNWLLKHYPNLLIRVPAKHIASYLDISEVTLSMIKGRQNRRDN